MADLQILALDTATPRIRAPATGDTYSAIRSINVTPEANTAGLTISGLSLTGASAESIASFSGTWDTSGTPTALLVSITDTASNGASRLLDFRRNGASVLQIDKFGNISGAGSGGFGTVYLGGTVASGSTSVIALAGTSAEGITCRDVGFYGFSSSSNPNHANRDTVLYRGAAGSIWQYNGANGQFYWLSGTRTDNSNYRRLSTGMTTAGVAHIRPEGAGTGASGNVLHISGLPTANPGPGILWNNAGIIAVGT